MMTVNSIRPFEVALVLDADPAEMDLGLRSQVPLMVKCSVLNADPAL